MTGSMFVNANGFYLILDIVSLEMLHYSNESIFLKGKIICCCSKLRGCSPTTFLVSFMELYGCMYFFIHVVILQKLYGKRWDKTTELCM